VSFAWVLTGKPAGSTASLTGADTPAPTFVADVTGDYIVSLMVRNADGLASYADTVVISAKNAPPTANAGPDQSAVTGHVFTLDGSSSSDPNGDPITFAWTLTMLFWPEALGSKRAWPRPHIAPP
jgi:PKD domain